MPTRTRPRTGTILKSNGNASVSTLVLPSRAEHVITVRGADGAALDRSLCGEAAARNAQILSRFVFAGASTQAFAISGARLVPVRLRGREIGFVYEDQDARYCHLNCVAPENRRAPRETQAREVFADLEAALKAQGFRFTDTVRTWFYLDRLLEWYGEFNQVRTAFFKEQGIFEKMVPASTGIGAGNPVGSALTCNLLAVQAKTGAVRIQAVPSPLQCPALDYQSSFSRAVEMVFPTHRSLLISGTASIGLDGKTAHQGDPAGQIALTMRVVEALLQSRGQTWNDVSRGIAYFTRLDDVRLFEQYCGAQHIPEFPLAVAQADICRAELLFEIEVDALQIRKH